MPKKEILDSNKRPIKGLYGDEEIKFSEDKIQSVFSNFQYEDEKGIRLALQQFVAALAGVNFSTHLEFTQSTEVNASAFSTYLGSDNPMSIKIISKALAQQSATVTIEVNNVKMILKPL